MSTIRTIRVIDRPTTAQILEAMHGMACRLEWNEHVVLKHFGEDGEGCVVETFRQMFLAEQEEDGALQDWALDEKYGPYEESSEPLAVDALEVASQEHSRAFGLPESAAACEFGQEEYDWHLRQAGL